MSLIHRLYLIHNSGSVFSFLFPLLFLSLTTVIHEIHDIFVEDPSYTGRRGSYFTLKSGLYRDPEILVYVLKPMRYQAMYECVGDPATICVTRVILGPGFVGHEGTGFLNE